MPPAAKRKWLRLLEDQVGLAHLPCGVVLGRCRRGLRIALRHASLDPLAQRRDISFAETAIVGKVAVIRLGKPWRHEAGLGYCHHLRAPAPGVRVCQQAEWSGAAGMMAGGAVVVENGRDVVGPGGVR